MTKTRLARYLNRKNLLIRERTVIHDTNLPAPFPIERTILVILALDHWNAHWTIWILGTAYLFFHWMACLYHIGLDKKIHVEQILNAVILPEYKK